MKCFYHRVDLDGECSAAIVKHQYPDCELIPYNYGEPFPWDKIGENEVVFMVDISLPIEDMIQLNDHTKNFIWIDHHVTAIEAAKEQGNVFAGKQLVGTGACQLVWEYLYPGTEVPWAVRALALYDVWRHDEMNGSFEFKHGMEARNTDPQDSQAMIALWKHLFGSGASWVSLVSDIVSEGEAILSYKKRKDAKYASECAFETELAGLKLIAINQTLTGSPLFESIWDPEKYDAMCAFAISTNGKWTVSLYSDKEDVHVGNVAKKFGGGGHKGAAGFQCTTLPFTLPLETADES